MKFVRAFGRFWWDFLIGDDWKIAAYTAVVLGIVIGLVASEALSDVVVALAGTVMLCGSFAAGVAYDTRRMSSSGGERP